MKPNIYLFCNLGYGSAYLDVFQAAASTLPGYRFQVVLSAARPEGSSLARRMANAISSPLATWRKLRRTGRHAASACAVVQVRDVNTDEFAASVPMGSIGFVAGFNQIFRKPVIDRFATFLNFHPSILPYYRGAIPSYWVLRNGEAITGFTVHSISEKVDAGEIQYQELVTINRHMTESELDAKIAAVGACYLRECLHAIVAGNRARRERVEPDYAVKVDYVPSTRA